MIVRFSCVLALVFWTAACGRRQPQTVSSVSAGQAMAATAQPPAAAAPAAANPEPVAPPASEPVSQPVAQPASEPVQPPVEAQVAPEPSATAAPPAAAIIPAGTRIRVRLGQSLDTRRSRPGERFVAYLASPVVSQGWVIVPTGTAFEGHVMEAKRSGRLKGRAYLEVRLDSFRLRGRTYAVSTAADWRSSTSHKKRNLAIIGGGAGTGVTIGAVAGGGIGALVGAGAGAAVGTTGAFLTGRKNLRLPVETPLVFSLRGSVALRG